MASDANLWDRAFQSLTPDLQKSLDGARSHKRDILGAVLKEAEAKRDLSLRKRWKFTRPNGEVVIVRDILEKIARWIQRFKETGDTIVQYAPNHAALPWAAVRFLLQMAVSEVQLFGAMADGLENTARMLVRYRVFESLYLRGSGSETELKLKEALTLLYAEILVFLSNAINFYREKSIVRVLKSPFRTFDEAQAKTMREREQEVNAFAALSDTETLSSLEAAFTRLSTQSSQSLSEKNFDDIVEWLSVAPYYHHHQFIAQSRLPGAGQWLLNHEKFLDWKSSSSPSLLLLHGIPGSGKSTLCSVLVDSLLSIASANPSAAPFGYFYCANPQSEKARRSAEDVMRTILFQLAIDAVHRTKMRDSLCTEYERQMALARVGKIDMAKLSVKDCVRLILELAEQDPMTIAIDGLDSIEDCERPAIIDALRELVAKADNVVKIFVTSRSTGRSAAKPNAEFQIQITTQETKDDMETFVNHLVDQAVGSKLLLEGNLRSETRSLLIRTLITGSHEMFLWAKLQVERICRETVEEDVVTALLDKLPQHLDLLYQECLEYIFNAGEKARDIAVKVLSCVLYIREPLRPKALLTALAAGQDSALELTQVMAICANLITLDTECNAMRLAHQSVQDFLIRHVAFAPAAAHQILASFCVNACLRGLDSASGEGIRIPSDDFYVYATMYWPVHSNIALNLGEDTSTVNILVKDITMFIFDEDWDTTLSFETWTRNAQELAPLLPREHAMKRALNAISASDFGFIFTLSIFGLDCILNDVLANIDDLDVNLQNDSGHTPIYLAAALGHSSTMSLLIEHGALINFECGKYGSPLHAACFSGHLEVVRGLLQFGAKVSCGSVFKTAFEAACRGGQEEVALHLLEVDSAVQTGEDYEEALEDAALVGFVKAVQQLQLPRFSAFRTEPVETTKLKTKTRKAVQGGQTGILRQFLSHNPQNRDLIPPDAVALATLLNHKSMVEFLLDQGMDMEADGAFGSPLRTASLLNYQSIVRLLLAKGARIDACGPFGDPLQAAALNGHTTILRLLIQEGAPVNQKTGFYGSALQAAAYHGRIDAVEILLDAKANVHQGGHCQDAFDAASKGGHESIVKLMRRKGRKPGLPMAAIAYFNPEPEPSRYKALLRDASPGRHDFKGQNKMKSTPQCIHPGGQLRKQKWPIADMETIFQAAVGAAQTKGHETKESSTAGFRRLRAYQSSRFALEDAASSGREDVINLLLSQRDSRVVSEDQVRNAITAAAKNGHFPIICMLVDFVVNWQQAEVDNLNMNVLVERISEHLSGNQYTSLRSKLNNITDKYHGKEVSKETVLLDFALSCKTGDLELATAILHTEHHKLLSADEIEGGVQFCALYGQNAVAGLVLKSPSLRGRKPTLVEEAFVAAAASGFVDMMKLLDAHSSDMLRPLRKTALDRALYVSSESGHIDAVRYLITELGADVNAHAVETGPLNLKLRFRDRYEYERSLQQTGRHPFLHGKHELAVKSRVLGGDENLVLIISPLQAALQGFARRFDPSCFLSDFMLSSSLSRKEQSKKATQHEHEQVIALLLENGCKVDDLAGQRMYPIQIAARYCSESIVGCMIAAGANLEVAGHDPLRLEPRYDLSNRDRLRLEFDSRDNALLQAAGRELSALPIVRRLVSAGAILPQDSETQHHLIARALRFFEGDASRIDFHSNTIDPDGRFRFAPSLEYVFTEGAGAVLQFLLRQIPEARTTDIEWNLVLQMAAFLNQGSFVDLLLSRGTNVNGTGYYYGTALQAAARCGHDTMVQKLLDAGAHVHITGGLWQTALRAAFVDGHEKIVHTIFDHCAGTSESESRGILPAVVQTSNLAITRGLLAKIKISPDNDWGLHNALVLAARTGDVKIATELIKAGALVNIQESERSKHRTSPIHEASEEGHLEMIELLISSGADIDINIKKNTPLSIAASNGKSEAVRLLLSAGARANDEAALDEAVRNDHTQIFEDLLAEGAEAIKSLALACALKKFETLDILIDNALRSNPPDIVLDKLFSVANLDCSFIPLLLGYPCLTTSLTDSQFLRVQEIVGPLSREDLTMNEFEAWLSCLN